MKAIVCTKYGPPEVLKLEEISKPVPKDNEVLIKNFATTASTGDMRVRRFIVKPSFWIPYRFQVGLRKPKKKMSVLGMDVAGEIEAVGSAVTKFKVGDQVFGATGTDRLGAYAEYVCIPEESKDGEITMKPSNMTYEEAASLPAWTTTALNFLRRGKIQSGDKVLINGASGAVGSAAVQLAKHQFEADVTGVCSTSKVELVKSLGADNVIDYKKEDFTKNRETYDVIFDTSGKLKFGSVKRSLTKKGVYITSDPSISLFIQMLWNKKLITGTAPVRAKDLIFLRELIEEGKLRAVIDKQFPLEDIVEAHRYLESGQKAGSVVITIAHE